MMVETLTDNRNRTAANLRHYFDKSRRQPGQHGLRGLLFSQQGVIVLDVEGKDEETVMEDVVRRGRRGLRYGRRRGGGDHYPARSARTRAALEDKGL